MSYKLASLVKGSVLLLVSSALLYLAFRGIDVRSVITGMLQANLLWVMLSIFISLVALVTRAYRWNLLIEPLGYVPNVHNTSAAVAIGYLFNLAFPRFGEFTRCGVLARTDKIPPDRLLGTVITERLVDAASLGLCILLSGIFEYKRLYGFFYDNIIMPILARVELLLRSPLAIAAIIVMFAALLWFIWHYRQNQARKTGESRFGILLKGVMGGVQTITRLRQPVMFVFYSVLIWVLYFLSIYVCLFAFSATSKLGLSAALFLLVAGGLGMSAPVQGGIGAYHILVSQGLVLYGLSRLDGLAFATMVHFSQLVFTVVCGLIALLLIAVKGGQKSQKGQKGQSYGETPKPLNPSTP